jgi:adenine deaminase
VIVARGDQPADLLLRNARLVNVFSGQIEETDIALFDGIIAGIGEIIMRRRRSICAEPMSRPG